MRYLKNIFLIFPFFLYLVQTSFPFRLHIFSFTPNILLCFFVALLFFPRSRSFFILLIGTLFCFFLSNSLTLFFNLFVITILSGGIFLVQRYYKFDKLSLTSILALISLSVLSEILIIIFSYWQNLISWNDIAIYSFKIGFIEIIVHFLLILIFIFIGNLFLHNNYSRMVIEK